MEISKSMLDFANNNGNIYLTDIDLLKKLLNELEKTVLNNSIWQE